MQPTLKLSAIVSGPNHRQYFDPQAMKELEAGIRAAGGVTQPILVRPHPEREGVFEIMAGERRWRAARTVHGDDYDMPVVVRDASDAEARSLGDRCAAGSVRGRRRRGHDGGVLGERKRARRIGEPARQYTEREGFEPSIGL